MLLTLESPRLDSPKQLKGELKLHQQTSLHACRELETQVSSTVTSKVGIIADPIGAGKTLLALSLCLLPDPVQKQIPKYTTEFFYLADPPRTSQQLNCNLVVVPHGLLLMWKQTLDKFFPTVKYQTIRFSRDLQDFALDSDTKVVLVSSTRLRRFCEDVPLSRKCWLRVFYEEADSINIPANRNLRARFYWLITATPRRLFPYHRCTGFLRRMVSNMYGLTFNGLLGQISIRNSDQTIAQSIRLPEIITETIRCLIPRQLRQVRRYVSKQVLEALNAGDTDTALTLLNCQVKSKENLTKAVKEDLEFKLNRAEARLRYQTDIGSPKEQLESSQRKVNSLKSQVNAIVERLGSQKHCPICLEEFSKELIRSTIPCCHHWYCLTCLSTALGRKPECPLCRKAMQPKDIIADVKNSKKTKKSKLPLKKDALLKLLEVPQKTLVFSNYNNSFLDIEGELKSKGIKYGHVKGHSSSIDKLITEYKTGDVSVLMLNSNYQGSGHNLENTERIILMHHIQKDLRAQVVGRAQRLGRKKPLHVIELFYPDEENK
jgi:SNF2 family DNA or RNA helicase